jgi:hypothetical protein
MLEHQQQQLVNGLQELYKQASTGQGWDGPPLNDNGSGRPLTHDILSRLGVLQQDSMSTSFDDDLESMQQRLIREGAGPMSRQDSEASEEDKELIQMSFFESSSMQRIPSTSYSPDQLPTPPPMQTPPTQTIGKASQLQPQILQTHGGYTAWADTSMNPADLQRQMWTQSPMHYEPAFLHSDAFSPFNNLSSNSQPQMLLGGDCGANVTMTDWIDEEFNSFSEI